MNIFKKIIKTTEITVANSKIRHVQRGLSDYLINLPNFKATKPIKNN
jgi:hypothetical protein